MADAKMDRERRLEIGRMRRARTRSSIIAAAFEIFGEEGGLFARVEDIAQRAGITRATFYAHFSGLQELREAVTYEVTHDFLSAVTYTVSLLADPRERASAAIRFYLYRALNNPKWGWSMINLSATGYIFGLETFHQAETTIREGIAAGMLSIEDSSVGRDAVLGTTFAAMATMLRSQPASDYPEKIAENILKSLGVPNAAAARLARHELPLLVNAPAAPG